MKSLEQIEKDIDQKLEGLSRLQDFFAPRLETAFNTNFLLDQEEYDYMVEEFSDVVTIIKPDVNLIELDLTDNHWIIVNSILEDGEKLYVAEMELNLYMILLKMIDDKNLKETDDKSLLVFKDEDEFQEVYNRVKKKLDLQTRGFAYTLNSFRDDIKSGYKDFKVGISDLKDNPSTFQADGVLGFMASSRLSSVYTLFYSDKIQLLNLKTGEYEYLQSSIMEDMSKLTENYMKLSDDKSVVYVNIRIHK